jgi:hypothetical protein
MLACHFLTQASTYLDAADRNTENSDPAKQHIGRLRKRLPAAAAAASASLRTNGKASRSASTDEVSTLVETILAANGTDMRHVYHQNLVPTTSDSESNCVRSHGAQFKFKNLETELIRIAEQFLRLKIGLSQKRNLLNRTASVLAFSHTITMTKLHTSRAIDGTYHQSKTMMTTKRYNNPLRTASASARGLVDTDQEYVRAELAFTEGTAPHSAHVNGLVARRAYVPLNSLYRKLDGSPESRALYLSEHRAHATYMASVKVTPWAQSILDGVCVCGGGGGCSIFILIVFL